MKLTILLDRRKPEKHVLSSLASLRMYENVSIVSVHSLSSLQRDRGIMLCFNSYFSNDYRASGKLFSSDARYFYPLPSSSTLPSPPKSKVSTCWGSYLKRSLL